MGRPCTLALLLWSLASCGALERAGVDPELRTDGPGRDVPRLEASLRWRAEPRAATAPREVPRAIEPLPREVAVDPAQAALGERLFADARLSGDQRISCAACHLLSRGGSNGEPHSSLPAREQPVAVNVPSIFNLAFDFRYGWDARYETLEAQLDFAMGSPAVMASSFARAAAHLHADESIVRAFANAYDEGLTADTLRDALVAYCRSAITPNARFDRYLRGELTLLEDELRGYEAFRDYGCISCHQGINVGGNMVQRLGVMRPYYTSESTTAPADLGRYNVTHDERDRHVFRVPSLRNVAESAPYLHDGSAATLEQAVAVMARYQLGRELPALQGRQIVAFLHTLTGEYRGQPL